VSIDHRRAAVNLIDAISLVAQRPARRVAELVPVSRDADDGNCRRGKEALNGMSGSHDRLPRLRTEPNRFSCAQILKTVPDPLWKTAVLATRLKPDTIRRATCDRARVRRVDRTVR
jgi:hypothetical protein